LMIALEVGLRLRIGRLGIHSLPPGYYVYVGSALGGLSSRLRRHLRSEKRLHWHIDYLLQQAAVSQIWYALGPDRLECKWNAILRNLPGATASIPKFGASDCRCSSHLTRFRTIPPFDLFEQSLRQSKLPQVHRVNELSFCCEPQTVRINGRPSLSTIMLSASIAPEWIWEKRWQAESMEMRGTCVQRFSMQLSPFWAPLLALFGARPSRSFADIDGNTLRVKFGFFYHTFPCDDVESAEERNWPLLFGIGWRTNLTGLIGLIGSYKNVVEIRFRTTHRVNMLIPHLRCDRLAISLKEPKHFLAHLDNCRKV